MSRPREYNNFEILEDHKTVKIEINSKTYGIMYAYCDLEDWEYVKEYKWYAGKSKSGTFYCLSERDDKGLKMHRLIMNFPERKEINHNDHNGLNNSKNNLELCDGIENVRYRRKGKNNVSGYKGVYWFKLSKKWRSVITVNKKKISLGFFRDPIEAAKAYNEAARKYFGNFALLNEFVSDV